MKVQIQVVLNWDFTRIRKAKSSTNGRNQLCLYIGTLMAQKRAIQWMDVFKSLLKKESRNKIVLTDTF